MGYKRLTPADVERLKVNLEAAKAELIEKERACITAIDVRSHNEAENDRASVASDIRRIEAELRNWTEHHMRTLDRSTAKRIYKADYIARNGSIECRRCGYSVVVEIHHIHPVAKGGSDDESNLIALCPNHHALADRAWRRVKGSWTGPKTKTELFAVFDSIERSHKGG
jgi:hypothetical protein